MQQLLKIAIDGPAGAGKGTLAKKLASALSLPYLDTGLLYRAVARLALDDGANPEKEGSYYIEALSQESFKRTDLRTAEVDEAASLVAKDPLVRQGLVAYQRTFVEKNGGVLDGRDIGTVILPEADVKFFITADSNIRAFRRFLQREGRRPSETELIRETQRIEARDQGDSQRKTAPLQKAEDAIEISSNTLSAEEMLVLALEHIKRTCQES
ncbi:(d)CMP kinase [Acetobacteraceae bacterium]|nr:(d)CMP kinase [Acetobacteraceae bacterium]